LFRRPCQSSCRSPCQSPCRSPCQSPSQSSFLSPFLSLSPCLSPFLSLWPLLSRRRLLNGCNENVTDEHSKSDLWQIDEDILGQVHSRASTLHESFTAVGRKQVSRSRDNKTKVHIWCALLRLCSVLCQCPVPRVRGPWSDCNSSVTPGQLCARLLGMEQRMKHDGLFAMSCQVTVSVPVASRHVCSFKDGTCLSRSGLQANPCPVSETLSWRICNIRALAG
jgi:hypothetical protein